MKKLLFGLILGLLVKSIFAQDTNRNQRLSTGFEIRYLNTLKVGTEKNNDADFSGTYGKSLRFNVGYFFNPFFYSGLSFGADRYEVAAANTFPITANMRYYLKDARNSLYTFLEGGPVISFSEASDKGYTGALGVGYKFFVSAKICLTATLGYNYQRSNITDDFSRNYFGDYISRKSLLFGLGMHF